MLGLTLPNAFANKIEKIDKDKTPGLVTGSFLNFNTLLYGETFIEVHWGNLPNPLGGPPLANTISSFYKFDAGMAGLDKIFLNIGSASNAIVYKTGTVPPPPAAVVPEPATWAMMLGGFAIIGSTMRRRSTSVSFA